MALGFGRLLDRIEDHGWCEKEEGVFEKGCKLQGYLPVGAFVKAGGAGIDRHIRPCASANIKCDEACRVVAG